MARRRRKSKASGAWIVAALVAVAALYAGGRFGNNIVRGGEAVMEAAEDTASPAPPAKAVATAEEAKKEASPAPSAKVRVKRAKGLEIPAYLTDRDEEIVPHEGFTLSYNKKRLVPNWVAWVLTSDRVNGHVKVFKDFQPDLTIKDGPIAQLSDYKGSGYDRGHMCPAADNKHSQEAMKQCCLLSNICPQTHANNAGDWEKLERLCRKWAVEFDSIFIVCGPIIEKGESYGTIGANGVMVPRQFYKVVLRLTDEADCGAEAIGFIMDNDDSARPIYTYAVTVDSVEERTGINFFSKLPRRVERRAEAQFDCSRWKSLQK